MINQYTLEGQYLRSFSKIIDAAKSFGDKWESAYDCIQKACMENSNKKIAYGYQWKMTEDISDIEPYIRNKSRSKALNQYDKEGRYIRTYVSIAEACAKTGIARSAICYALRCHTLSHGFQWRLVTASDIKGIAPYQKKKRIGKQINQYDLQGKYLCSFDSISEAAESIGVKSDRMLWADRNEKPLKGYQWRITKDTSDIK